LIGSLGVALALASGSALASTYRLGTLGNAAVRQGLAIHASGQVTGFASAV
jgi:hypothetical protein